MRDEKVVALAVQLIDVPQGVIVKRGVEEVFVAGEAAAEVVTGLLTAAGTIPGGVRPEELAAMMRGERHQLDVGGIVSELCARKILVGVAERPRYAERPDEVLAWNLGVHPEAAAARLDAVSLNLLGVNLVSGAIADGLSAIGVPCHVVDHPDLRNVRLFTADGRLRPDAWHGRPAPEAFDTWQATPPAGDLICLVACSDFGGLQALAEWNARTFRSGWHFLPVVLQNLVGIVGPLVMPGETACFQCLLARENANLPAAPMTRAVETAAFQGQSIAAYHPAMAATIGNVAALELTKHYGYGWASAAIGKTIEVNMMAATMRSRPILKVPGCPVCGPLSARGAPRLRGPRPPVDE
jgi:bacteriocin biosynthesis cyclodehydratase domain-containing protein